MGVGSINGRYFAANGYTCSLSQDSEGDFFATETSFAKVCGKFRNP